MKARSTEVAGRISIWLAALFALFTVPIPMINTLTGSSYSLPMDVAVPYLFGTLTSFMAYVYGRLEQQRVQQERLLNRRSDGVEVFHTSAEFLDKLMEITVGAEQVSTLNLSPPRGQHSNLDEYFRQVHQSIKSRRGPLRSFRSIASLDVLSKPAFLVDRTSELIDTGKASFAVFDQDAVVSLPHPLSIHITVKDGQSFVFLFPPVNLTGTMDSVLIRNEDMARVLTDYFNILWQRSLPLNEGRRADRSGLERLARLSPEIRERQSFQELMRMT